MTSKHLHHTESDLLWRCDLCLDFGAGGQGVVDDVLCFEWNHGRQGFEAGGRTGPLVECDPVLESLCNPETIVNPAHPCHAPSHETPFAGNLGAARMPRLGDFTWSANRGDSLEQPVG